MELLCNLRNMKTISLSLLSASVKYFSILCNPRDDPKGLIYSLKSFGCPDHCILTLSQINVNYFYEQGDIK